MHAAVWCPQSLIYDAHDWVDVRVHTYSLSTDNNESSFGAVTALPRSAFRCVQVIRSVGMSTGHRAPSSQYLILSPARFMNL